MEKTYEMMRNLCDKEDIDLTYDELLSRYILTNEAKLFAAIYVKSFKLINRIGNKYYSLTSEDKASQSLETLERSIRNFSSNKRCRFLTYYSHVFEMACRSYVTAQNSKKSILNYISLSLDEEINSEKPSSDNHLTRLSLIEDVDSVTKFENVDNEVFVNQLKSLTPSEKFYIKGVLEHKSNKEIADEWGVTASRIYFIRQSLQKKLNREMILQFDLV